MSRSTFRLVLLVSCAHALVHVFELALPSVEQLIGDEFDVNERVTGSMGTAWRVPFGMGALLAGWLADRYGSKRMLLVYLAGCAATGLMAAIAPTLWILFAAMVAMGCFAAIYHPAGLSLISRVTTPETRGQALGWHGILGSIGIAAAPLTAGVLFGTGVTGWRGYYAALVVPAVLIAIMLARLVPDDRPGRNNDTGSDSAFESEFAMRWKSYLVLVTTGALSGIVYAGFLHFLPRYLDETGLRPAGMESSSFRNYLAAMVLLFGVAGQAIAGRLARPGRLEPMLTLILAGSVPCLCWMAVADGSSRLAATCTLAVVHFMSQPVYNSLVAQYVPASRRSTGYGFSNMLTFGIGALGPLYAGFAGDQALVYGGLAVVVGVAAVLAGGLWIGRDSVPDPATETRAGGDSKSPRC